LSRSAEPEASAGGEGGAGSLAIVLHSHMPYVEGFGTYPFGEEWLFDAFCRSYVPVLDVAERLTLTITPVLADQLEAPGLAGRLREFARRFRLEAARADARELGAAHAAACRAEEERYARVLERLQQVGDDLLAPFRAAAARGVELAASAATHAVLPLVATRAGRRLQLDAGMRSHARRFGPARSFWLPECAYEPGLERLLAERGVASFCVDQSGHEEPLAALTPVETRAGPMAFPIDWEAVQWLWSLDGYPADPVHVDFHRRSPRGGRPWAVGGGAYDPGRARARAREQAAAFVAAVAERLAAVRARTGHSGVVVFAIDTELLGHWWWEGPAWLAEVLRLAPGAGVRALTLSEARAEHPAERRELRAASWGAGKDLRTWDAPDVADLAWATRRLELRLLRAMGEGLRPPAAARAARELLALQASDWAFLDGRRQAGDYPFARATAHAAALLETLEGGESEPSLRNLAPDLSLAPLLEP
jgi:1,4-alpha-glucan branching enzyme